jgi:hypothetical protein
MPDLEICLIALALVGLVLGAWGILWARFSQVKGRTTWGRGLFIATIIFLAISSSVAAFHHAEGLVPLGLTAGFLVIGMLWEAPPHKLPALQEIVASDKT